MGGETVNGSSWLSALWPVSRKGASDKKAVVVGVLGSEVAGLMLKVVSLWQSLSDEEVLSLKEGVVNSVGVRRLVSEDDDYLMELVLNEILDNFQSVARTVARLGRRCVDPVYHRFEHFVHSPAQNYFQWSGWDYRGKKMERKVKRMEKFVAAMTQLCQELEVLAEVEQTLRRMQANPVLHRGKLPEFQKKVTLQRQEVRNLRDMSPWNRSYDYVVRLLVRSLFTILERIILVFGNNHLATKQNENESPNTTANNLLRSQSFSVFMHSSVHPSENDLYGFHSGHLGRRLASNSGILVDKKQRKKKQQQALHPPALCRDRLNSESKQFGPIGPFKSCMSVANNSPVIDSFVQTNGGSMRLTDSHMKNVDKMKRVEKSSLSNRIRIYSKLSMSNRLKPASFTLGDAALTLHYANMIVLIEQMVSSPHLTDPEPRDDLYKMLPATIRAVLRHKLKGRKKSKSSWVYNAEIAAEWSAVLAQILDWLAPLAHDTIRWHSVRSFEKEHATLKANILLVQTLYFANQVKTEAAIVDLLVGLNYVCRIDTKVGVRDRVECASARSFHGVGLRKNGMYSECF